MKNNQTPQKEKGKNEKVRTTRKEGEKNQNHPPKKREKEAKKLK